MDTESQKAGKGLGTYGRTKSALYIPAVTPLMDTELLRLKGPEKQNLALRTTGLSLPKEQDPTFLTYNSERSLQHTLTLLRNNV